MSLIGGLTVYRYSGGPINFFFYFISTWRTFMRSSLPYFNWMDHIERRHIFVTSHICNVKTKIGMWIFIGCYRDSLVCCVYCLTDSLLRQVSTSCSSLSLLHCLRRYTRFVKVVRIWHFLVSINKIWYFKSIYRTKFRGHRANYGRKGV